ncbi:MAG TPA: PD-(D/E)XK nuclease family protein [Patescibacteria group bacterium]|nr:PD-(D/E)XK nuclease family protein [Patescibacteria group bacterium]
MLTLSKSALGTYMFCPAMYKLAYLDKHTKMTDYARLAGAEVHRFIASLYRHTKERRPFFYKDIYKAQKAWFAAWKRALEDNGKILQRPNPDKANEFGAAGWLCIKNYWTVSENRPRPLTVEKRYSYPIMAGVTLVGIFDQIRPVSMEDIRRVRPDLIQNGTIRNGYDPVLIVDLKTGWLNYDIGTFPSDAPEMQQAWKQAGLLSDVQGAAYTWLYQRIHGRLPVGFLLWGLREGKMFPTYGGESRFSIVRDQVQHVVDGLNAQDFTPNPGRHCTYCDYFVPCQSGKGLQVTRTLRGFSADTPIRSVELPLTPNTPKQLRLKLRAPRVTKKK